MSKIMHEKFMKQAIAEAEQGLERGQTPFAACIVLRGKLISCVHNKVWMRKDITAHAEIMAIREACRKLKTIDLSSSVIYSTCEPCPMCFSACHWARISTIVYGANIQDAKRLGFNELKISNRNLKKIGKSPLKIISGVLRQENLKLFEFWVSRNNKRLY